VSHDNREKDTQIKEAAKVTGSNLLLILSWVFLVVSGTVEIAKNFSEISSNTINRIRYIDLSKLRSVIFERRISVVAIG
jgi:hypothetical protein